jgi:hypothetical protein
MASDAIVSYFAVAVWMVGVWRSSRGRHTNERDDVGRGVGQGVKAVREDRNRPCRVAEGDLGGGNERG